MYIYGQFLEVFLTDGYSQSYTILHRKKCFSFAYCSMWNPLPIERDTFIHILRINVHELVYSQLGQRDNTIGAHQNQ